MKSEVFSTTLSAFLGSRSMSSFSGLFFFTKRVKWKSFDGKLFHSIRMEIYSLLIFMKIILWKKFLSQLKGLFLLLLFPRVSIFDLLLKNMFSIQNYSIQFEFTAKIFLKISHLFPLERHPLERIWTWKIYWLQQS